jgi:hypothetical protein
MAKHSRVGLDEPFYVYLVYIRVLKASGGPRGRGSGDCAGRIDALS